jgi:hypothetical protein
VNVSKAIAKAAGTGLIFRAVQEAFLMFAKVVAFVSLAALSGAGTFQKPPVGWHTYTSTDYGFTISYPPTVRMYNIARGEDPGGDPAICEDTTVACFGYPGDEFDGTNFAGAGIAINVLRDPKTEQECNTLGSAQYPSPATRTVNIHGTRFHVGDAGGGSGMKYQNGLAYRALYQNVCFEIETQIDGVSMSVYDPGTIKEFDSEKLEKLFDEMVPTFQFVGPVKDGPNWKVFRDDGCGGTFEYPVGVTIRVNAEYSNARYDSDRIMCSHSFSDHGRDYTLAVKANLPDESKLQAWLKSSGHPGLEKAKIVQKSQWYTDYEEGPYRYIYGQGTLFILSVSNPAGHVISPGDDSIYRHWLASFQVD